MATGQKLMRAIRVFEFGGPDVLKFQSDIAVPIPKDHQVEIITLKKSKITEYESLEHQVNIQKKQIHNDYKDIELGQSLHCLHL